MNITRHYLMTFSALFFLGLIISKPGETFNPSKEDRECKINKGKMDCDTKIKQPLQNSAIHYIYQ